MMMVLSPRVSGMASPPSASIRLLGIGRGRYPSLPFPSRGKRVWPGVGWCV